MPDTTPIYGLPFPEGIDPPDGPSQIEALAQGVEDQLVDGTGVRSYGKSIIAAEQFTSSSTYTLLGTPDRVQGIVMPTDGLIFVVYEALVLSAGGSSAAGRAAIFIGESQLKAKARNTLPLPTEAGITSVDSYRWLVSSPLGLGCDPNVDLPASDGDDATTLAYSSDSTICVIKALAGTYDVSVRFKATALQVWAKERELRVWSQAFG